MSWATQHITELQAGKTVRFRPRGNSMVGLIDSGNLCTVVPVHDADVLDEGDIVLCVVNGQQYLHLIKSIKGEKYQIGNNRGGINGWIPISYIYGRCIKVEK